MQSKGQECVHKFRENFSKMGIMKKKKRLDFLYSKNALFGLFGSEYEL